MARVEALSYKEGCLEETFIQNAGRAVALVAQQLGGSRVLLLLGKGNKGADACAAGMELLGKGFFVKALCVCDFQECSFWNRKFFKQFLERGGSEAPLEEAFHQEFDLVIDGLLGTGFHGKLSEPFLKAIRWANRSKAVVIAIDIPSGVDPTTGTVDQEAIKADHTVTLGMAKSGLFLRDGWTHTGILHAADFGLPHKFMQQAKRMARLIDISDLKLPVIKRTQHKYEAGYVLAVAGSTLFPGAAKLAGMAAMRAGAGIVRIFHQGVIGDAPFELISQPWNEKAFKKELERAGAVLVGPGFGEKGIQQILKKIKLPLVVDGAALQKKIIFPKGSILTPHRGEMLRLLGKATIGKEEEFLSECDRFSEKNKVVLILKGAPTWIFVPGESPVIVPFGDPGMATAGSGDVLTGILAALLAKKIGANHAAYLGVYLHARAGEIAAQEKGSFSMIASDIITCLPQVFRALEG
jgi:NAD(P)H-hydrate epimerase